RSEDLHEAVGQRQEAPDPTTGQGIPGRAFLRTVGRAGIQSTGPGSRRRRNSEVTKRPLDDGKWKLDESCISNPKSENSNWTGRSHYGRVQFEISDFGFEMQDSSNFKFSDRLP